jgi:hypothetical protein
MDVCAFITTKTSYTIEQILDHPLSWVTELANSLAKLDFEDRIFQMALHGIGEKKINELRHSFYKQFEDSSEQKDNALIPINDFKARGILIGKQSNTRVKR